MFISSRASAQSEIKLGHVSEPGSRFDQTAQEFAPPAWS